MPLDLSRARTLLLDVPNHAKLAYCLMRDERVPTAPKAALLAALGIVVSPLDVPAWIPVVGELDVLALSLLAVKVFIDACPDELVREQQVAIRAGTSAWDRDFSGLLGFVRQAAATVGERIRRGSFGGRTPLPDREDRTA